MKAWQAGRWHGWLAVCTAVWTVSGIGKASPVAASLSTVDSGRSRRSTEAGVKQASEGRRKLVRPQQPRQTLAMSRYRWAVLQGDIVHVYRLRDLQEVARFPVAGARNLVPLTGGSFLVAGAGTTARISPLGLAPRMFPALPLVGPTTLFPSSQRSQRLLASYEGIESLVEFDLEHLAPRVLPAVAWRRATGLNNHALLQLTDGSLVYTTQRGLVHAAPGRPDRLLPSEGLDEVWAVRRAPEFSEVWVFDRFHASRLAVFGQTPTLRERWPLPRRALAAATARGWWAVLSVESQSPESVQFLVEVRETNTDKVWRVRWSEPLSPFADEAQPDRFRPELVLCPRGRWVAVRALGVTLIDFEEASVRAFPAFTGNLAQPKG